eukprot:gene18836-60652_t
MRERCVHLLLVGSERIPLDGGAVWYNTGFDYSEKDGGGLDDKWHRLGLRDPLGAAQRQVPDRPGRGYSCGSPLGAAAKGGTG